MAKEGIAIEEDLEDVIVNREKETPSRIRKKDNVVVKVAKLTGRTISSLKTKVKEKRLAKAYEKYNKNYKKMRIALVDANVLKTAYERGEDVSQSEVVEAFDIVESYNKKLSKYAVRLLEDDIKKASQKEKARPLRVPRILLGKLRPISTFIGKTRDKFKNKKLQKEVAKDIKAGTREYIENSIEGALFEDVASGELREEVDAKVIQGLATNKKAETFEEKIANLRRFISEDGKTSLFDEEEIGVKTKTGIEVPPPEPKSSVEKQPEKSGEADQSKVAKENNANQVTTIDLFKGLNKKDADEKQPEKSGEADQPKVAKENNANQVTTTDLFKGLNKKDTDEKQPEKSGESDQSKVAKENNANQGTKEEDKSERNREINAIIGMKNAMTGLERLLEVTTDPELRKDIILSMEDAKTSIDEYIHDSLKKQPGNKEEEFKKETIKPIDVTLQDNKNTEENVTSLHDGDKKKYFVRFKNSELRRVEQVSNPAQYKITPDDIKRLEERNDDIQRQISSLTKEKEELLAQKAMYERAIELDKASREGQMQVDKLTEELTPLRGEVADLGEQVAPIFSGLAKK